MKSEVEYRDSEYVSNWRMRRTVGLGWLGLFGLSFPLLATLLLIFADGRAILLSALLYLIGIPAIIRFARFREVRISSAGIALPFESSGPVKRFLPLSDGLQARVIRRGSHLYVLFAVDIEDASEIELTDPRCKAMFRLDDLGNPDAFVEALKHYVRTTVQL